jgi:hypothetical protein
MARFTEGVKAGVKEGGGGDPLSQLAEVERMSTALEVLAMVAEALSPPPDVKEGGGGAMGGLHLSLATLDAVILMTSTIHPARSSSSCYYAVLVSMRHWTTSCLTPCIDWNYKAIDHLSYGHLLVITQY